MKLMLKISLFTLTLQELKYKLWNSYILNSVDAEWKFSEAIIRTKRQLDTNRSLTVAETLTLSTGDLSFDPFTCTRLYVTMISTIGYIDVP